MTGSRETIGASYTGGRDEALRASVDADGGRDGALRGRVPHEQRERRRRTQGWRRRVRRSGRRHLRIPQRGRALLRRRTFLLLDADVPVLSRRVDRIPRRSVPAETRRRPTRLRHGPNDARLSVRRNWCDRVQAVPAAGGVHWRRLDIELDARVLQVAQRAHDASAQLRASGVFAVDRAPCVASGPLRALGSDDVRCAYGALHER